MAAQMLAELLDLELLELNLFRGQSRDDGFPQVFGGQVIAQGLVAATRTTEHDRAPHSLHAYFLRPGDMNRPIVFEVERIRDGRSFSTRRVQAIQQGEVILSMIASFHVDEPGFEHQLPMPAVAAPDTLRSGLDLYREWEKTQEGLPGLPWLLATAAKVGVEFRPVLPRKDGVPPRQQFWFRINSQLPDDSLTHQCALAYVSDFALLGTAKLPHGGYQPPSVLKTASLDHALWFHRPFRVDEWLLYAMDSPSAQSARGLARGEIYDQQGRLVASVAQEGLIRSRKPPVDAGD